MFRAILFGFLLVTPSAAARAEWYRADSAHFVVYADDSERDLTTFARQLERFHSALSIVTGTDTEVPSPSNRVTVYVVRTERQVRDLYGGKDRYVGGFYLPRAGASIAVVPSVNVRTALAEGSMLTLLHEYAHHFFSQTSTFPLPRWMSEGGAEFVSSAGFETDGDITVGRPAQHRAMELHYASDVSAEELLDPDVYEANKGKSKRYDAFYGRAWLLYHYLFFTPEREGQLASYGRLLVAGKSQREAALEAFGDFAQLDKDLDNYMRKRRMGLITVRGDHVRESPVTIRPLTAGEIALMPILVQSKVGVTTEEAAALLTEARSVAARFPRDPAVLAALAEAEHDAENYDASIAAADAALAIDAGQVNAYVQKGYSLFAKAGDADDTERAYMEALQPFLQLNRMENDHPIPLIYFYRSYLEQGLRPTSLAVTGLERAAQLAPFDMALRLMAGREQISRGRYKSARFNLTAVAYNPHGGSAADAAAQLLATMADRKDAPAARE